MKTIARIAVITAALAVAACATSPHSSPSPMFDTLHASEHRGQDDLLTAGQGADGLRSLTAPPFSNPQAPTAAESRRRAIWSSWRGIADLAPAGGFGTVYGTFQPVPGREFSTLAHVAGADHPQRVLAQIPDAFSHAKRCLVVTVASGSRGVYGAMAVGAAWGLPRGCAVVHSDKAAGSDYFDLDAGQGVNLQGQVADSALAFTPAQTSGQGVAFKHAHSQDNPEADWGRHTKQAAEFGLHALNLAFPDAEPFTFANTRVIAVGISNGGGAVLRAAELDGDWLDGVVAGEPNIYADAPGSRPLYDYASQAALLMPCALPALGLPGGEHSETLCSALAEAGVLQGASLAERQQSALAAMRASGWTDAAIAGGAASVAYDLWRTLMVTYASAYTRAAHDAHPCGYRFAAGDSAQPRPANAEERGKWFAEGSGIPPGAGVNIIEPAAGTASGLQCLVQLWHGQSEAAQRLREGVAATRAKPPASDVPVLLVHGADDGLIPLAFSSAPYVAAARSAGRSNVRLWQVNKAQHFDAFLAMPPFAAAYVPLLPYVYTALDRLDAHLDGKAELPDDAVINPTPRGTGRLRMADLDMPEG